MLRSGLASGSRTAVVIADADADSRADRSGATVISSGAFGVAPLRVTEHTEPDGKAKRQ
jgi:coenzyme F420-0:L-glutamate ligase/coenzyme F420-1:gamma-L-glutamate ligase